MIRSNTQWFNIINYDFFTIYFARPTTLPDLVKVFSRYAKPIGLCFEKTISIDESFILLSSLTNLTSLEIEPNFSIEGRSNSLSAQIVAHFTALKNLQRLNLFQTEVTPYIQHFPKLTTLEIRVENGISVKPFNHHEYSAEDLKILSKLGDHTELRSLTIDDFNGCLQFDAEDLTKMSKVTHLSCVDHDKKFPFTKLPNLESLEIYCSEFDDFSVNSKLTKVIIGMMNEEKDSTAPEQLASLYNLKYLSLGGGLSNEQMSFLGKLTELEYFSNGYLNGSSHGSFLRLINSSKLTSLSVHGLVPTLEHISHLTSLQQLEYWSPEYQLTGDPSFTLPNVTKLISSEVPMAEICPNVKEFRVLFRGIHRVQKSLDILASLTAVESLCMTAPIKEHIRVISKYTQLTQLEYSLADKLETSDLQSLTRLKKLKIHYNDSALDGEAIRSMTNLEELSLNQFSEEMIETLERLPRLKVLLVNSPAVEHIPDTKLSNLTNLQVLKWLNTFSPVTIQKTDNLLPYLYKYL